MDKIIVFDLDDTLYLEQDFVASGFKAVDEYLKTNYSLNDFFNVAWNLFLDGDRGFIFNHSLKKFPNFSYSDELVEKLIDIYRNHKPMINLLEDSKWALEYYKKRNKLALISDGYLLTQKNKLESLGISNLFDRIYLTDFWGKNFWKPNIRAFVHTESFFGKGSNNFVYISDNPEKDFIAPNKLGWDTIQIKRDRGEYANKTATKEGKPNIVIETLFRLKDYI